MSKLVPPPPSAVAGPAMYLHSLRSLDCWNHFDGARYAHFYGWSSRRRDTQAWETRWTPKLWSRRVKLTHLLQADFPSRFSCVLSGTRPQQDIRTANHVILRSAAWQSFICTELRLLEEHQQHAARALPPAATKISMVRAGRPAATQLLSTGRVS